MLNGKSLKQKKRTSPSNFRYSIQTRDQIPASSDSFKFLNEINLKNVFPIQKKTNKQTNKQKNHHPILHIQISISSKFQLQQIISIFWKNFFKKGYFWPKQKIKNITIEFFIFKLVQVSTSVQTDKFVFCFLFAQKGHFGSQKN